MLLSFTPRQLQLLPPNVTRPARRRQDLVVGWYRFRRRSPCRPSLRERVIHAELCRRRPRQAADTAGFVFLLMTDNVVEDVVHHEHVAFVLKDRWVVSSVQTCLSFRS